MSEPNFDFRSRVPFLGTDPVFRTFLFVQRLRVGSSSNLKFKIPTCERKTFIKIRFLVPGPYILFGWAQLFFSFLFIRVFLSAVGGF